MADTPKQIEAATRIAVRHCSRVFVKHRVDEECHSSGAYAELQFHRVD